MPFTADAGQIIGKDGMTPFRVVIQKGNHDFIFFRFLHLIRLGRHDSGHKKEAESMSLPFPIYKGKGKTALVHLYACTWDKMKKI